MSNVEVVELLKQAIELLESSGGTDQRVPDVYDLQPEGFAKLRVVEEFRKELLDKRDDKLAQRYALTVLPEYWYVQDMETYFTDYTPEMEQNQEYACAQARFSPSSHPDKFTFWFYAYKSEVDEDGRGREVILYKDNKAVGAVASDSRNASGTKLLKANPRVVDMAGMVRRNYAYFYERNKDAYLNPTTTFRPTP